MLVRRWCCALATLLCAAIICSPAQAQVSGRITGTVVDSSGSVVVGATITLVNERTGDVRTAESNDTGLFVFPNVPPSSYSVSVQAKGFSTLERTNLVLSANQSLALGNLQLAVGDLTDTVTVAATGAAVELDTSGQNQVITAKQLGGLMSRGRDIVSLITVLPGVSQNASSDSVGGNWGTGTPNMQGLRSHWNTFQLDGQPGNDIDVLNFFTMSVSMDAVEEVSVKSNSYLAEEGRLPGANVNIVSKSGTQEFRGSGYYFKRHEQLNANNFFNNRLGIPKPLTRYDTFGATLGGPVVIPGKFNSNRDKLFFFLSREDWRIKLPGPILQATLPTDLERMGDFSQSVDQNGQLIRVVDPMTGMPFPGNIIPASRMHPMGRNLLALLPQPNLLDRSITRGAFNYRDQETAKQPKAQTQLKIDWMPTTRDRISFRPRWWSSDRQAQSSTTAFGANFLFQQHHYEYVTNAYAASYTRIFSPNLVNEFNVGYSEAKELGTLNDDFQLANVRRERHGLERLGQLFPSANPLNLIPRLSFGGLPSAPNIDFDPRTPIAAGDERVWITNNLTWVTGNHNLKFGVYYEMNNASEGPRADAAGRHMGTFDFGRDGNNPFDSNHPFANALLGNFRQYSESSGLSAGRAQIYTIEWFAQDSWKVTPRLTLDYGARFYSFTPWRLRFDEGAAFAVSRYDAANVPRLYFPARNAAGTRVAMNPNTGELAPAVLIGAFAPGPGDRFTGIVVGGDESYPDGFRERPPVQIGPRAGFAYDLFGNGKTAVRGGFGVHKQTIFSSQASMWTTTTAPPILESPTIFYGNLDGFLGASQVFFPTDYQSFDQDFDKVPTTYRWSFGIQQDIGFGTVADITYVGSEGRNLRQSKNINTLPPGIRFLPSSQDPTTGRPLPDNFLRPYPGFQNLSFQEESGFSNYHALQVGVSRRYTAGLQLGIAYTWSKAMGISDQDNGGLPLYRDVRSYLYGKLGYDQTHVFVFNYLWSLPNARLFAGSRAARLLFHDWEVAGITSFASGTPVGINFSYTDGVDRHGGGDPPRVNVIADPTLPRSERSFEQWFNTDAFAAPGVGDFGDAPRDVFRGPGINNSDLALLKYFPLGGRTRFQFRWEIYNLFNHPQWAGVDNNARFDAAGRQVNGQFGQVTSARDARQMQFSLRVEF